MVVRCASDDDFDKWMQSLKTQVVENERATYVRPMLSSSEHQTKVSETFVRIKCNGSILNILQ